ncbi:MAG: signal recognition particle-docking protein FtsY [Deltaproteobacteria bacterium]|nr:signal recognition particle-docking protein FtsY [Deltaproteobacteria bacterium]MBI3389517.1 signal recognition particle-docking protein FtsY [Deltaproteobacteria bacterium]
MPLGPELIAGLTAGGLLVFGGLIAWLSRRARGRAELSAPAHGHTETRDEATAPWATFRSGLSKTRQVFGTRLRDVLGRDRTREAWLNDLEEALILADVGMATTQGLIRSLRKRSGLVSADAVVSALKAEIRLLLEDGAGVERAARPHVILVVGVNGVGKTTTIGKLAHRYKQEGKSVLLVAGDTFRAAATEQLEVWAERVGCDIVKHKSGADPAAVVFDGLRAAQTRGTDVAIIDTAGRLHVKVNLMEELKKLVRVISREVPGAPHEAFLVLDASTGQNALSQTKLFRDTLPLTGVILTKLDGTAKGGAVLAVKRELNLPLCYLGLGEGINDLRPFDAAAFTDALFEPDSAG